MHPVSRVVPFALGCAVFAALRAAESAPLPPIFAPKANPPKTQGPPVARSVPSTPLRQAMFESILAAAKVFEATPRVASVTADFSPTMVSSDGVLLMQRFLVRAVVPPASEVERRPPVLELGRFSPMERVDRRRNGLSMPIMSFGDGKSLELNVVNGAGYGADHNVDFVRVELGFRMRF